MTIKNCLDVEFSEMLFHEYHSCFHILLAHQDIKNYPAVIYLASWIDKKQGGDKTPVVVYGHKDPWMLVCFFACVKSGRAYCPVDVSMPGDRVMDIVEKLGNPLVLATEAMEYEDAYGIDNLKRSAETEEPVDKAKWAAGEQRDRKSVV